MRFLTIEVEGDSHPALVLEDGKVLDLICAPDSLFEDDWRPQSVRNILELAGGLEKLKKIRDKAQKKIEQLSSLVLDIQQVSFL
ncbi:MAG: hypothetical protein VX617_06500, partial [Pseudomonadota bacterium]|nr:hypothetical protein [Pseudomonadota bacterium]